MERRDLSLAAVVLAAGSGSRFGREPGGKLLADLEGRPLLGHVLDTVRAYGPARTVVVLGASADDIEAALEWRDELRVRNPSPKDGLASSIRLGIEALVSLPGSIDGAFIVLGDQPRLTIETMEALERAASTSRPADRVFVVPRYLDDPARDVRIDPGPRNPVLLLRPAWSMVERIEGDRGLGPLIESHPDQVLDVQVRGAMPDVDRPADLAELELRGGGAPFG